MNNERQGRVLTLELQDVIANSPFSLLHIPVSNILENLMLDQDNNLCLISMSILITCLLDDVWIL